jgi:hypothetical protein
MDVLSIYLSPPRAQEPITPNDLCPDKPKVVDQDYRVLNPDGRLQMAEMLLEPHVTPGEVASRGSWSD